MKIEVLGSGCRACKNLHEVVRRVVKEEKIDAEVEYSDDIQRIVELGLLKSPVLLIDGKPIEFKSVKEKDVKEAILSKNSDGKECNCNCSCGGDCC